VQGRKEDYTLYVLMFLFKSEGSIFYRVYTNMSRYLVNNPIPFLKQKREKRLLSNLNEHLKSDILIASTNE